MTFIFFYRLPISPHIPITRWVSRPCVAQRPVVSLCALPFFVRTLACGTDGAAATIRLQYVIESMVPKQAILTKNLEPRVVSSEIVTVGQTVC